MDNPFIEQKYLELLSAPAYNWLFCENGNGYYFGIDEGNEVVGPIPRAFMALSDGMAVITPADPSADEIWFEVKTGMFFPAALRVIASDSTADIMVFF
jgi:hypothetical protein